MPSIVPKDVVTWRKQIAAQHKAADLACGRKWSCICGACRVVRSSR
jgi:hypothetical protein